VQHLARSPRIGLGCQNIPVLSISPATSDHADLEALLFTPQWKVHRAVSLPSALSQLRHLRPIPVVVCERNLVQVTWQEVLMETVLLREPPCFIITSRFADDYLWAEALNLGAYDVLTKPFDPIELTRAVSLAWQHSESRRPITRTPSIVSRVAAA
jgi:DNA-binding NtrC family response regulator